MSTLGFLSVRRVTIPLPFAYQANALPIELRTVAGVYRYLLITSNGPLLGELVGKVGFEPTNLQFQVLVFTDVTLYFTIITEEIRKSIFEFLPHIYCAHRWNRTTLDKSLTSTNCYLLRTLSLYD